MTVQELMEEKVLRYRNQIYGICAIWIIWFHISDRIPVPGDPGVIGPLIRTGNVCVDIFLFLSGYCICASWKRKPDLKQYFEKRIKRILVPYLVLSSPIYIWKHLVQFPLEGGRFHLAGFLGDITTLNFWKDGMQTTWFVAAILLFYILFPVLYKIISHNGKAAAALIFFLWGANAWGYCFWPAYQSASIAWTRLVIFSLGILAGCYGDRMVLKHPQRTLGLSVLFTAWFTVVFPVRDLYRNVLHWRYETLWLFYTFLVPGFLAVLYQICKRLPDRWNAFLQWIGSLSLELYMIHVFLLRLKDYYFTRESFGWKVYPAILALSLLIAYGYQVLRRKILKW